MKTNVLIFPAGEINSIELHDALSYNVNINVFGASSIDRHGPYVFKNYKSGLPFIDNNNFIDELNKLIVEWQIDIIFPTHDTVALFLSKNAKYIKAKIIVSDYNTALICRDKKKTYDLFSDCDFIPKLYTACSDFPLFIKPINGQGAKGTLLINNRNDIPNNIDINNYVISEYLPGDELTVDCLTDNNGNLLVCLPRLRNRILAGVCVSGISISVTKEILSIGEIINKRLKFKGLWYFQLKKDINGKYKLLEISTRCAGSMCLTRALGVNLPLLSVYIAIGKDISVFFNQYNIQMDRTFITRYKIDYDYDKIFIDYDDTIIINDKVSLNVMRYLYQCYNQGIKIYLITRHNCDHKDTIEQSLCKHSISQSLFYKISNLTFDESKVDFIIPDKAIFIDNSYSERKLIHDKYNIPVFDVEGIEVLLDWKQ